MSSNPYENPDFANNYVLNQASRSKNRYEWEVTHPATLQFLDSDVDRVLDYGCGGGIFSAGMAHAARHNLNPSLELVGTDASTEMLRYASAMGDTTDGASFQEWNAATNESALQDKSFDRVFAKLVLNYVSKKDLSETVMPRLRECLTPDGLLVAIFPNPLREAGYSNSNYQSMDQIDITVGNFGAENATQSYHHTYEEVITAADRAGFAYGRVLGLPEVRFEPYKRQLMKIAHPMPMIFDTLNAAKRWVYVFGATEASADNFDASVARFEKWRAHFYPEIADRAHIRIAAQVDSDTALPIQIPHDALYDYVNSSSNRVVSVTGKYAETMNPKQKLKLVKSLAKVGLRSKVNVQDFLVDV